MEQDFTIDEVINLMKRTKKTDTLFKPLKKLKTAIEGIGLGSISLVPTSKVVVFHFGLGNQIDKEFINLTNPIGLAHKLAIIPGHSYAVLQFTNPQASSDYLQSKTKINDRPVFYQDIQYQNLNRVLIFMFCRQDFLKEAENFNIPNCSSIYKENTLPGLFLIDEIMTKEEEVELLKRIDEGAWEKLNNRRVQHFGYKFKYGRNQVDKDQKEGILPEFFGGLIERLRKFEILKDACFDQLTINDYFAGNGIPAHFDTHSPFEEIFISVSMLSGIVMEFKRYDGEERSVYLRERSVAIFSGEARYAWIHGISCRKIDKVDDEIHYRSRRISLTFRKIKFTPCKCPYYFYCDSQGYNQETMKKNNPLLTKYMSQLHYGELQKMKPFEIEKEYVEKAYNGFGFDFHNKVIEEVKEYMMKEFKEGEIVLDLGCGNGQYKKHTNDSYFYLSVEKCTTMVPVDDQLYMDCLRLTFRAEIFDRVIFVAVLHHFASRQTRLQALREIQRVMKKEAILYLTVLSYEGKSEIYSTPQIFLEYCLPSNKLEAKNGLPKQIEMQVPRIETRGEIYKRYYHLFTTQELLDLLKEAKLTPLETLTNKENIIIKATKLQ